MSFLIGRLCGLSLAGEEGVRIINNIMIFYHLQVCFALFVTYIFIMMMNDDDVQVHLFFSTTDLTGMMNDDE